MNAERVELLVACTIERPARMRLIDRSECILAFTASKATRALDA